MLDIFEIIGWFFLKRKIQIKSYLKICSYYLFFYNLAIEVQTENDRIKIFPAQGDIIIPTYAFPTKLNVVNRIKSEWEKRGHNVTGIFLTSVERLNKKEFLFWAHGIEKSGIPTYESLKHFYESN